MAPIRIPEGYVLIPGRSVETATALLDAADKIKADRKLDVRTTAGGYHVTEAVAEEYQKAFPDARIEGYDEIVSDGTSDEPVELEGEPVEGGSASADAPVLAEALPVTADSTHAEIDEYAASLDPKVEFPAGTNKAEKIALLEEARKPTPDAE